MVVYESTSNVILSGPGGELRNGRRGFWFGNVAFTEMEL